MLKLSYNQKLVMKSLQIQVEAQMPASFNMRNWFDVEPRVLYVTLVSKHIIEETSTPVDTACHRVCLEPQRARPEIFPTGLRSSASPLRSATTVVNGCGIRTPHSHSNIAFAARIVVPLTESLQLFMIKAAMINKATERSRKISAKVRQNNVVIAQSPPTVTAQPCIISQP